MAFATLLSNPYCLLLIGVTLIAALSAQRRRRVPLPDLPWINRDPNVWFSKLRARFRTTINQKASIRYAYHEYSGRSKSCILPSLAENIILLPADSVNWIINQPDSALSSIDVLTTQLQTKYTFSLPHIVDNTTHHETIRGDLTRHLASLTQPILDEIAESFNESWGADTVNWKEVCVFETVMRIIARTSNRVFVGSPMCRDNNLLKHASGWSQAVPLAASILRHFPKPVTPILGPLLSLPAHYHHRAYARVLIPEILRRQNSYNAAEKGTKPNDFLQWQIDRSAASGIPNESDPKTIAARLLATTFAAVHTSTFSITQTIFDLVASSPEAVEALRQESTAALVATDNQWSKATLQLLFRHDSCLRESTRLGSFLSVGMVRRVVEPQGLTAPNGTHCPYDSWIGVASNGVHNDPAIYPESDTYKPFRFYDMREADAKASVEASRDLESTKETEREALIKKANLSFVSVSPHYHPFGHGRHACPGRFFAANELKVLLAYMVQNYDFEFLETRPPSRWIGPVLIPPRTATIRVRRRPT